MPRHSTVGTLAPKHWVEQKNNSKASGVFGTTTLKAYTGNELDASHTLSNTQIQTIQRVGETSPTPLLLVLIFRRIRNAP